MPLVSFTRIHDVSGVIEFLATTVEQRTKSNMYTADFIIIFYMPKVKSNEPEEK
jgi:hypothetical protein